MKTLVIGAGPAGLMAAIHASNNKNEVVIFEKNEKAGKKIFITGKGRCNVTNNCNEEDFIKNVVSNKKFLYSAIYNFSSKNAIDFFEANKTHLVIERGNRVFPASYKAYEITDCLVKVCKQNNVRFYFNESVVSINKKNDKFYVSTNNGNYIFDYVIIATGGLAYPSTGSTGDGYKFACDLGHSVTDLVPALTGLVIKENVDDSMFGLTLKNVSLTVKDAKFKHTEFGELTFYKRCLEGPISITTSSLINRRDPKSVELEIDLKPALDEQKLLERINRDIQANPNMDVYTLLKGMLPIAMIYFFTRNSNINEKERCTNISNARRLELVTKLKHFKLTYLGLNSFEKAIVTAGGINVKEINASSMESKLVSNLYFAGEVIDVDAYTGGFNIQIAMSTGALAGDSIKEKTI